ncbi:hypothetical protein CCR94_05605 [Rhodoblastus sphagnicola]|uniref:Uncharacterized protein n=1 Tax=Rhodoblastus sphagnicola TaxID=333368 RepID=A0A2S6NCW3_9HYPH|nr:hypothetical protein [Rhodoblastus sphagnicola]MBB4196302.1 hypothetical protein [Rhodoblastus sphagnicola]PPQ32443.1 hypothetical protein CCR94_05605 [Rhodoblastus sphagnicola]
MGESIESVAEQALIKLLFALSDLESHGLPTRHLSDAREQLVSAIEILSRVAPRFDDARGVGRPVGASCVNCRRERKHYV